jgi:C1A family cysteine protease
MQLRLVMGLLFGASAAFGQPVQIAGKTYQTGYLPRPLSAMATDTYYTPSKALIDELPESYDARDDGLVTPIKNQGSCGSCWAFARAKAFEAALIKAGKLQESGSVDLAEQDTLVNDRSASGCNGGYMDGDFEVQSGVSTEDLCPYRASSRYGCQGEKFAKATRWAMLGARGRAPTVDELKAAIYQYGVLAVTVAAGGGFSPNRDGRITTCGSWMLNHMVTLAGYRPAPGGGTEFLIGNSWGTDWGDGGFAWSKQGCNKLASTAGDAALFYYFE